MTFLFPLQLEVAVAKEFEGELQQAINWDASRGILRPKDYIDKWRILLWDMAFLPIFVAKGNLKFTKGTELNKMDDGKKIINRAMFRYFSLSTLIFYFIQVLYKTSLKLLFMQQVCPLQARCQGCICTLLHLFLLAVVYG